MASISLEAFCLLQSYKEVDFLKLESKKMQIYFPFHFGACHKLKSTEGLGKAFDFYVLFLLETPTFLIYLQQ